MIRLNLILLCSLLATPIFAATYHINIDRDLTPLYDFKVQLAILDEAKQGDVIYMTLNTIGGRDDIGHKIFKSIKNSNAHVIAVVPKLTGSWGAMLVCAADEVRVSKGAAVVYHLGHFSTPKDMTFNVKELHATLSDKINFNYRELTACKKFPFMTDQVIAEIMTGKDVGLRFDGDGVFYAAK